MSLSGALQRVQGSGLWLGRLILNFTFTVGSDWVPEWHGVLLGIYKQGGVSPSTVEITIIYNPAEYAIFLSRSVN